MEQSPSRLWALVMRQHRAKSPSKGLDFDPTMHITCCSTRHNWLSHTDCIHPAYPDMVIGEVFRRLF